MGPPLCLQAPEHLKPRCHDFIYLNEAEVGVQWKFHAGFYKESLEIVSLSAKEGRNSCSSPVQQSGRPRFQTSYTLRRLCC